MLYNVYSYTDSVDNTNVTRDDVSLTVRTQSNSNWGKKKKNLYSVMCGRKVHHCVTVSYQFANELTIRLSQFSHCLQAAAQPQLPIVWVLLVTIADISKWVSVPFHSWPHGGERQAWNKVKLPGPMRFVPSICCGKATRRATRDKQSSSSSQSSLPSDCARFRATFVSLFKLVFPSRGKRKTWHH